jgi:uncharacterized damage-inducible protein DinB
MNQESKRIHHLLARTFSGEAWHGTPVTQLLENVTAAQARARPVTGGHTIGELVLHMISWRNFARQKLVGDPAYDIRTPEEDWPGLEFTDEASWKTTLRTLADSQEQLLAAIATMHDAQLNETVPGRNYSYYILLHGIIVHDVYHAGQIALLKKGIMTDQ